MNDARSASLVRQAQSPAEVLRPRQKWPRHRAQALLQPALELV